MPKLGDELTVDGVTYVLVDASLFMKLDPDANLVCKFCALDPQEFLPVCLATNCDIDNSNADTVYVRKLEEVKNE